MADAVGLGKTIEAGILLAELIRRGHGRRILVVAVKSMLTQLQKELWARFTIPLVRLDSEGLQRIRALIPTNANPFHYYDKAIISIDTLKQDAEYRVYLEHARWDVIVIDEAHNVAERGQQSSLRARLARLLATRSDTLIMASATPHDGRPRSFASLMNMLDATAIADPDHYDPDDIRGLFLRRFKKDIRAQVEGAFLDRTITEHRATASPAEEAAFEWLVAMTFRSFDRVRRSGHHLFRTVLEKALFSSPAACLQTIRERLRKLGKEPASGQAPGPAPGPSASTPLEVAHDRAQLEELERRVAAITPADFTKYQKLVAALRPGGELGWNPSDPKDRLVIFTERIETLRFLETHLKEDLRLAGDQVATLWGDADDSELQATVEAFGRDRAPVRLLIASDIASEGINLHYLSHRMVHFDIPWSLMVFQQRNGRIDRYGQERRPEIAFFRTESAHPKIRGDQRILDLLVEKDRQAGLNIGDPSVFLGAWDERQEELEVGRAIEDGDTPEAFEARMQKLAAQDFLAAFFAGEPVPDGAEARARTRDMPSLFPSDLAYARAAFGYLRPRHDLHVVENAAAELLTVTLTRDLQRAFRALPPEAVPEDATLHLTTDRARVKAAIRACRAAERQWPDVHLLWDLHPVMEWLNLRLLVAFGRHQAPVVTLGAGLEPRTACYVVVGEVPNLKGQPAIHSWFAVVARPGLVLETATLDEFLRRTRFHETAVANPGAALDLLPWQSLLPDVVRAARAWMSARRAEWQAGVEPKLAETRRNLERLKQRQREQLDLQFPDDGTLKGTRLDRRREQERTIERRFRDHEEWVADTMTTEDSPYLRIAALFVAGGRT